MATKKQNIFRKIGNFLTEVRAELSKASWATPKEVGGATVVIIILVLIASAFIALVDFLLSSGLALVMR